MCLRRAVASLLLLSLAAAGSSAQSILTIAGGGPIGDGRKATEATLRHPTAVAIDASGNLFLTDMTNHRVRRVDKLTGIVTTYAGGGSSGLGDGGPATAAELLSPTDLAFDAAGNLYIASIRIRRVDHVTGVITTYAGGGTQNASVDGIHATDADMNAHSLTFDPAGNLVVTDQLTSRVRRIDKSTGIITTIAGTSFGFGGDGGPAIQARLGRPEGLVYDAAGNLLIADTQNSRIRRVDNSTGLITTYAGNGEQSDAGDGLPASQASMFYPHSLAFDTSGTLYVTHCCGVVRSIDPITTIVSTFAGTSPGYGGDGGPARDARLDTPLGLSIAAGTLYIADGQNDRIRAIDLTTTIISTVAGGGPIGDNGPATSAILAAPRGVALDSSGNLFVADTDAYRIRRVDTASGAITTYAGTGEASIAGDGGPATEASFLNTNGVATDARGNLYIAARFGRVRRIDAATGIITTVAGNDDANSQPVDGVPATQSGLDHPEGVALDSHGNIYIADTDNRRIRKVDAATGLISTIAGRGPKVKDGPAQFGGEGGPATEAFIGRPHGVAVDAEGNVYIADFDFNRIWRVEKTTSKLVTAAGGGEEWIPNEGEIDATKARLMQPRGVTVAPDGQVYISEYALIALDPGRGKVRRVVGCLGCLSGLTGDGGPAIAARVNNPGGIAVDASGNLFFADELNDRVRAIYACVNVGTATLTAPSSGATNVSTAPTLAWNAVPGAFRYDVRMAEGSGQLNTVATDLTVTTYTPANLQPGVTYRWQVVAKGDRFCPSPSTSSSETRTFTVAPGCAAPGSFALSSPADGLVVATPPVLSWSAASGADSYDVYVGPSNPPPFAGSTTSTSLTTSSLVPGTQYFWSVVARASCDPTLTTASSVRSFTLTGACAAAGAFTLTSPSPSATGVPISTALEWNASANAASYDLYFGTTNPPPIHLADLTQTRYDIAGLLQGRTYFWRVIAKVACDPTKNFISALSSFTTAGECNVPGTTEIVLTPPGNVAVGQTYVLAWSHASGLDVDGYYQIERARDTAFTQGVDTQLTSNNAAAFLSVAAGTYHHRVRAVAGCDPAKSGPWSIDRIVNVVAGNPNVIFTVLPEAVVTNLGEKLEDKRATFTLENISTQPVQAILGKAEINSVPFFTIVDPLGGDSVFVTLEPRRPKTFELRYSGPPNDETAAYQGLVVVNAPGSTIIPYAFVNLKVGSAGSSAPRFKVGGFESGYAFFPGFAGGDDLRAPITVTIENPGTTPMELGAEIGPEVWLVPEPDWNASPIPAGASRDVKLFTRRNRAPNGSALPRYTYFTIRTRGGEKARLLVQDSDATSATGARTSAGTAPVRSYIVPDVVSSQGQVSTIRLTNAGAESVQATLIATPTGADGYDAAKVRSASVIVPPNDVVTLTDPLVQVLRLSRPASAQVEVRAPEEKVGTLTVASSIVLANDVTRIAAPVPVLWRAEGAATGRPHVIAGIRRSGDAVTALILVETGGIDRATVRLSLYDATGAIRGATSIVVARYGRTEIPDVVGTLAGAGSSFEAGRIDIEVTDGGGSVVGLARVVRAGGGAATFVSQPAETSDSATRIASDLPTWNASLVQQVLVVPVVVTGSWDPRAQQIIQTLIGFVGAKNGPVRFTVVFHGGGTPVTKSFSVPAGQILEYADVLRQLFGIDGSAFGSLTITADAGASVYSLAAPVPVQGVPPVPTSAIPVIPASSGGLTSVSTGRPLSIDGLEQSVDPSRGVRWNLYLTETRGGAGKVTVRLYEAGNRSQPIAEKDFDIGALGRVRMETVFAAMGLDSDDRRKDRTNVLCVVIPKSGTALVSALAVSIDNRTGDSQTWLLAPTGGSPATRSLAGQVTKDAQRRRPVRR